MAITKLLAKHEYKLLLWAESSAKDMLYAHVGGPYEQRYREKLSRLRKLLIKIKRAEKTSIV